MITSRERELSGEGQTDFLGQHQRSVLGCTCVKTKWTVHLRSGHFTVHKLNLNLKTKVTGGRWSKGTNVQLEDKSVPRI